MKAFAVVCLALLTACATNDAVEDRHSCLPGHGDVRTGRSACPPLGAGFRWSVYGPDYDPGPEYWGRVGLDMARKFKGAVPETLWIVSRLRGQGTLLNFPVNATDPLITGSQTDENEATLDHFDRLGYRVWLQIEPGYASVDELIDLVMKQYSHHPSVIGFGIDVEWYRSSNPDEGQAVTDEEARAWVARIRTYNPKYRLFLKHFTADKMPPNEREGLLFVDDSQILPDMKSMIDEFAAWGRRFAPAPVAFQYGYPSDRPWWSRLEDPPREIGQAILDATPNTEGLYWVDFTVIEQFPPAVLAPTAPPTAEQSGKFAGLALTPPMGWNSWNKFQCNVDERLIRETADAMVASGMKDAGYQYVIIDDCWPGERDGQGFIQPDPKRFPSGMKALADYVHAKGLKLGIYSDAGWKTCGGRPGSRGYEYQDARTYASWGIDYLKYDWCNTEGLKAVGAYLTMSNALRAAGRPIVLSICEWGDNQPWTWAQDVGHLWRTTGDITSCWDCVVDHGTWNSYGILNILDMQQFLRSAARPDAWNDPDMMEVGNGMSASEDRAHFSMWSMLAAPLIAGNDLRTMSAETRAILTNRDVIAVNQDRLGIQGFKTRAADGVEYWFKPLADEEWAAVILNRGSRAQSVTIDWAKESVNDSLSRRAMTSHPYRMRDLWAGTDRGDTSTKLEAEIPPHMRRRLLLLAVLLLIGCATTRPNESPQAHRIVAYVFGNRADINRINAWKLTHVNYAFGLVNEAGEAFLREPEASWDLAQLQALKAKNPQLKILVSFGGWGADNFSDAALTDESRRKFTASAMTILRRYALDGIDLDWEYPAQPGPGVKFRPEDKQNFTLLLQMLRRELDALSDQRSLTGNDRYALTIATSGDERYFANTEMSVLHRYLDWINIMTYDFSGAWSEKTAHHSNLWPSLWGGHAAVNYVKRHLDAGIPSRKLVLGVPFYGRGWTDVNAANKGMNQPYAGKALEGLLGYSRLLAEYIDKNGFEHHWDSEAKAPYLWNEQSRTVIVYDDPQSLLEKTRYIKRNRLGGAMYWEHSHDPNELLLNVLYTNLR